MQTEACNANNSGRIMVSGVLMGVTLVLFGPFLIGGTLVAFLWGKELVDWYTSLLLA